ncbi:MAG: hypothetical protein AAGA02_02315 [Bacteroidota bacterium]
MKFHKTPEQTPISKLVRVVTPLYSFKKLMTSLVLVGGYLTFLNSCGVVQTGGLIASGKTESFVLQQSFEFNKNDRVDYNAVVLATGTEMNMKVTAETDNSYTFDVDKTSAAEKFFLYKNLEISISTYIGPLYNDKGQLSDKMTLSLTGSVVANYKEGTRENLKSYLDKFEETFLANLEKQASQTHSN